MNFKFLLRTTVIGGIVGGTLVKVSAQPNASDLSNTGIATITTAVPFLMINPSARWGSLGDIGVSTEADASSMHYNVGKLAMAPKDMSFDVSYSPWLRALVPDINLGYLGFYKKVGTRTAIGGSIRYFSLGDITFTDMAGNTIGNYNPNEFSIDIGASLKLSQYWSGGISFKFIYSNLTLGQNVNGQATNPGLAGGGDLGFYFQNPDKKLFKKPCTWRFGVAINNIGSKIKYSNAQANGDFIPTNFRIGGGCQLELDKFNSISWHVEMAKLMVPSNPIYERDSATGYVKVDPATGQPVILYGQDPNRNAFTAMFTSFGDSPYGFLGEMSEITLQTGVEYWYNKLLRVGAGFFYETPSAGNRQFFTLGAGVRYKVFGLDFSYLIPTRQRNPLENTLRFTLSFHFDKFGKGKKDANNTTDGEKNKTIKKKN
jgi:hypothetical protein